MKTFGLVLLCTSSFLVASCAKKHSNPESANSVSNLDVTHIKQIIYSEGGWFGPPSGPGGSTLTLQFDALGVSSGSFSCLYTGGPCALPVSISSDASTQILAQLKAATIQEMSYKPVTADSGGAQIEIFGEDGSDRIYQVIVGGNQFQNKLTLINPQLPSALEALTPNSSSCMAPNSTF